jgi:hypothetical protein
VDVIIVSVDKRGKLAAVIKDVAVSGCVIAEALFVRRVSHGFLENRGRDGRRGSYSSKDVIAVLVVSILLVYSASASASSDVSSRGRSSLGGVPHCALSPLAVRHKLRVCDLAELVRACVLPLVVIAHANRL